MINPDVHTERSADVLEIATQATAVAAAVAWEAAKANVMPEKVVNDDGTVTTQGKDENGNWKIPYCRCGEDLPEGRMLLGRVRCIACQTLIEKRKNGY